MILLEAGSKVILGLGQFLGYLFRFLTLISCVNHFYLEYLVGKWVPFEIPSQANLEKNLNLNILKESEILQDQILMVSVSL